MKVRIVLMLTTLWGCASRPILHSANKTGEEEGRKDVARCEDEADRSINEFQSERGKEAVKIGNKKGGGPTGVISSILKGDVAGGYLGTLDINSFKKKIIAQCLVQRGHRVIGFD